MAESPFRWPLSVSTFSVADKLRIAWWLLTTDRYTMGEKTVAFEKAMSDYSGMKALMVSSGSTANQLVFEVWKAKNPGVVPVVICPAVTWISSVSPAIMAGMEVVFCDVNLIDLSFDYTMLEQLLATHKDRRVIIWPTALIGFVPDMIFIHALAAVHGAAEVYLDSCENTFSRVMDGEETASVLSLADMTTTSGYFAHQIVALECGFLFMRDQADYETARMIRNHGMVRSLPADSVRRLAIERANPDVDPQFLFALLGTNLRPTDVHAMFGLQDMKRAPESTAHRKDIYRRYQLRLDVDRYYLPPEQDSHVAFCLPIIRRDGRIAQVKRALNEAGIETRPLVGGCLPGLQPAFRAYGPAERYPNALWLHRRAGYIGVHEAVTSAMVDDLIDVLDSVS